MNKNNELTDEDITIELNMSKIFLYSNQNTEEKIDELCTLTRSILSYIKNKNLIEVCDYEIKSSDLETHIIKFILKCKII